MTKDEARKAIEQMQLPATQAKAARRTLVRATRSEDIEVMKAILGQIIRGERPWSDLARIGISMELAGNRCSWKNPRHLSVTADIRDLAKGFMANRDDPQKLREWALFIEAGDVDLEIEDDPASALVLEAIWDAAFLNPIEPGALKTLKDLAQEQEL